MYVCVYSVHSTLYIRDGRILPFFEKSLSEVFGHTKLNKKGPRYIKYLFF